MAAYLDLISIKTFDGSQHGGLIKPSYLLVEVLGIYRATFQTFVKNLLRKNGIRQNFKDKFLSLDISHKLKRNDCDCLTPQSVASLFLTVRIHKELSNRNEEFLNKTSRKRNRKLATLEHK